MKIRGRKTSREFPRAKIIYETRTFLPNTRPLVTFCADHRHYPHAHWPCPGQPPDILQRCCVGSWVLENEARGTLARTVRGRFGDIAEGPAPDPCRVFRLLWMAASILSPSH
jgi:hypothetical protein